MIAAISRPEINNYEDVIEYFERLVFIDIRDGRKTKSIYFKNSDGDYWIYINTLLYGSYTLLATVEGQSYNFEITADQFTNIYKKYKIFLVK
jgi:hypothetical protein